MSDKVIIANEFAKKWCEALGIPAKRTSRITIDAKVGNALVVYVSMFGTDDLLKIEPPDAHGVEIVGGPS